MKSLSHLPPRRLQDSSNTRDLEDEAEIKGREHPIISSMWAPLALVPPCLPKLAVLLPKWTRQGISLRPTGKRASQLLLISFGLSIGEITGVCGKGLSSTLPCSQQQTPPEWLPFSTLNCSCWYPLSFPLLTAAGSCHSPGFYTVTGKKQGPKMSCKRDGETVREGGPCL